MRSPSHVNDGQHLTVGHAEKDGALLAVNLAFGGLADMLSEQS
jgi:hypothetical protein